MVRIDVVERFPELTEHLMELLRGLSVSEWRAPTPCPGWTVQDLVAHLLGVEAGNVSVRRDGWRPVEGPDALGGIDVWNERWVDACRRMSPAVLLELLEPAARSFNEHVSSLDLDAMGPPVGWATGEAPAPVWLDVARELMERAVHQQQLRDATGREPLPEHVTEAIVATAVHCLPVALAGVARPPGTTVVFRSGAGAWAVTREERSWRLSAGEVAGPACEVGTTLDGAVRLFVRDPGAPAPAVEGDPELARAIRAARAIL